MSYTLVKGDALDLIQAEKGTFDLIATDPPYAFGGSGEEHAISATVAVVQSQSGNEMSNAVEQGWAVWFWLEQPGSRQRVWVNHGDGYSPSRRCRKVFGSRWEAEEARDERRDRKPNIVRVVYYSARARGGPKAVIFPERPTPLASKDGSDG